MNWLNKLDNALDNALESTFLFRNQEEEEGRDQQQQQQQQQGENNQNTKIKEQNDNDFMEEDFFHDEELFMNQMEDEEDVSTLDDDTAVAVEEDKNEAARAGVRLIAAPVTTMITPMPSSHRVSTQGGGMSGLSSLRNPTTGRGGRRIATRPGMILSVARRDLSDSSSSEDDDDNDNDIVVNDNDNDDNESSNQVIQQQGKEEDKPIVLGQNISTLSNDDHGNNFEQISPIPSPRHSATETLQNPLFVHHRHHVQTLYDKNNIDCNDDQEKNNEQQQAQSQQHPPLKQTQPSTTILPLPILTSKTQRVQSTTTVQISNMRDKTNTSEAPKLTSTLLSPSPRLPPPSPRPPMQTIDVQARPNNSNKNLKEQLIIAPPPPPPPSRNNNNNNNSNTNPTIDNKEQNQEHQQANEIVNNNNLPSTSIACNTTSYNNMIISRQSSNTSAQTDLIQNTSTLTSNFDADENADDIDDDYHQEQNHDNVLSSIQNKHDNQVTHKEEEEEEEATVEDTNQNEEEKKSSTNKKKKGGKGKSQFFQATMGDYLFSQNFVSTAGNSSDNDHDVQSDDYEEEEDDDENDFVEEEDEEEEDADWEEEDYIISTPFYTWGQDENHGNTTHETLASPLPKLDPSLNRHGIVHVKLLRIQHLQISAGSSIEAIISLPPWKGRIRSERITSYNGPSKAGVCARWDVKNDEAKEKASYADEDIRDNEDDEDNEQSDAIDDQLSINNSPENSGTQCHSMVHTYNNDETPIPSVAIELKGSALQMFTRDICSFNLSCEPLMRNPNVLRRRWCAAEQNKGDIPFKSTKRSDEKTEEIQKGIPTSPMILIEASFEPTIFDSSVVPSTLASVKEETKNDGTDISSQVRERCETLESYETSPNKRLTTKPHLFRVYSEWRPTYCTVCSSMILRSGYRCEECKLDCCADCQLRVDVELPCGSENAIAVTKKLANSKLTMAKIYSVIAPEKIKVKKVESEDRVSMRKETLPGERSKQNVSDWTDGVGVLNLKIVQACLFQRPFPPEAEMSLILQDSDRWLRRGDHYARVSWTDSKETKRTKAVFQTSKPIFDSEEMHITALHYGTEFRIEVLDASTDASIGSNLVTTHGLLQWQRDKVALDGGLELSSIITQEPLKTKRRKVILELRSGVKSGFGLDYYKTGSKAGEISGWIEVEMSFVEDADIHDNKKPKPCPIRPENDFNIELIQLHIARIVSIVEDLNELIGAYKYLVSWKNPALTGLSFTIFVTLCLRFNTEYFGSLPFGFALMYMILLSSKRTKGYQAHLQRKERDASLKEVKGATVQYRSHRPTGLLKVRVNRGQNLTPQVGLGIPGSLVSTVSWDPIKFLDEASKKTVSKFDITTKSIYHVGETESSSVTFNPEWRCMHDSNQLKRLKQLLPSTNFLSRTNANDVEIIEDTNSQDEKIEELEVPILQPIAAVQINTETEDDENGNSKSDDIELLPWEESHGAIVVQVRFTDVLNKLPIFDQVLGEVVIPFHKVVKERVDGWFQVLPKGTLETIEENLIEDIRTDEKDKKSFLTRLTDPDSEHIKQSELEKDSLPRVYVQANFELPNDNVTDIDKETSIVVAEHMIVSVGTIKDSRGFIGSSLETFNTVRGVTTQVQYLQNKLGNILDAIEIIRNAFNFTCPEKSTFILICFGIFWFLFAVLPTRFVIFCAGLGQYIATFIARMTLITKTKLESKDSTIVSDRSNLSSSQQNSIAESTTNDDSYNPVVTRIINFFKSIPTNEDLRRCYFWEVRKVGEKEREKWAEKKRTARLTKLYQAQWFGSLEMKTSNAIPSPSTAADDGKEIRREWDWISIFAIIKGHRFVWWESEKDFDAGENPAGQIFFAGHAGLAGLSPLELRELKSNEIEKVVNIFGRGSGAKGQLKISLLLLNKSMKDSLEGAVLNATVYGKTE